MVISVYVRSVDGRHLSFGKRIMVGDKVTELLVRELKLRPTQLEALDTF